MLRPCCHSPHASTDSAAHSQSQWACVANKTEPYWALPQPTLPFHRLYITQPNTARKGKPGPKTPCTQMTPVVVYWWGTLPPLPLKRKEKLY